MREVKELQTEVSQDITQQNISDTSYHYNPSPDSHEGRVSNFLKGIDMYGQTINFSLDVAKAKITSQIGGLMSILFSSFIIYFISNELNLMYRYAGSLF